MNLIRVGTLIINLDNVTNVRMRDGGMGLPELLIYIPVTFEDDGQVFLSITGDEATAVWTYLSDLAVTVQS